MLSTLKEEMNRYINVLKLQQEFHSDSIRKAKESYIGQKLEVELSKINSTHRAIRRDGQNAMRDKCAMYINIARKKIEEIICAPTSSDFGNTLSALKTMGESKGLSAEYLRTMLRNCNSYMEYSAILSVAHDNGLLLDVECLKPEALKSQLDFVQDSVNLLCSTDVEDGLKMAIISENPTITSINEDINRFTSGDYEVHSKIENEMGLNSSESE